ncbi:P-loop containing nucleoside triphosphatehydrolases superfamily protein [Striga asiatica]|uniref:P-loop containing nucleoside triphosphatehydrolases superfamily protein n=1 Tax=Striga asiatica TaxID=4170 RepID=A0A5A7RH24_STRAF|nr:P-loop containing nucleoside triphosphatehydrolases superfamily protein [Striga asiatica]
MNLGSNAPRVDSTFSAKNIHAVKCCFINLWILINHGIVVKVYTTCLRDSSHDPPYHNSTPVSLLDSGQMTHQTPRHKSQNPINLHQAPIVLLSSQMKSNHPTGFTVIELDMQRA